MLYFVQYNISIPFIKPWLLQLNKNLLIVATFNPIHHRPSVHLGTTVGIGSLPELCITFHLHYISFAFKNHATSARNA